MPSTCTCSISMRRQHVAPASKCQYVLPACSIIMRRQHVTSASTCAASMCRQHVCRQAAPVGVVDDNDESQNYNRPLLSLCNPYFVQVCGSSICWPLLHVSSVVSACVVCGSARPEADADNVFVVQAAETAKPITEQASPLSASCLRACCLHVFWHATAFELTMFARSSLFVSSFSRPREALTDDHEA